MTRNKDFNNITNFDRYRQCCTKMHQDYLNRISAYYGITGKDLSRFAWAEDRNVNLYFLEVFVDSINDITSKGCIVFAEINSSSCNKLFHMNLIDETSNHDFGEISPVKIDKKLAWLAQHGFISQDLINNIITASLHFTYGDINRKYTLNELHKEWAKRWVDKEYTETQKILQKKNILETFPTSNQKFFVDRYHFDEMLNTLDDNQFTDEFNQCLFAYENRKWFLCATGLGTCLEHLMEKIIINYNNKGYKTLSRLGKDPTFKDYLIIFRKPPINMEPRQETYIKMLSMARNSVDNHNTGYTKKNICDALLDGIRNIFNDYYSTSILVKSAPKDKK
ncbi:hypothetical protein [Limosilactobacillus reuteri]|uniref:hypothetical protein n=1 Tax=Limosilactobacillus reuteri TaxID=1598 RepID=UPI0013E973C6|nr:hypothetical protein [Limosilactobacillus reuteri]